MTIESGHVIVLAVCVDVRTQADYQMMDPNFIGLIFSCFNEADKVSALVPHMHTCTQTVFATNSRLMVHNAMQCVNAADVAEQNYTYTSAFYPACIVSLP